MKPQLKASLQRFVLELLLYTGLVAAYYFLVLHLLGHRLENLYEHRRQLYAALALCLIVAQGMLLEVLTRILMSWMTPRGETE